MSDKDEKSTVEESGRAPKAAATAKTPTIEEHAEALNVPAWQQAGLKAKHGWPIGHRVSRTKYNAELKKWLEGPTVGTPASKGGKE